MFRELDDEVFGAPEAEGIEEHEQSCPIGRSHHIVTYRRSYKSVRMRITLSQLHHDRHPLDLVAQLERPAFADRRVLDYGLHPGAPAQGLRSFAANVRMGVQGGIKRRIGVRD
jgi:hypothetical protein